jgi:hypothetical protein
MVNAMLKITTAIFVAAFLAIGTPVWATVIETDVPSLTDNYNSVISATDLINVGQASLSSVTQVSGYFNGGYGLPGTHDGIGQDGATQNNTAFTYDGAVDIRYSLNTDPTSGGSATGYDITGASLVAGWPNYGLYSRQSWSVSVATVADPSTYTLLKNVEYFPYTDANSFVTGYTHVALSDSTGKLATGVVGIKLVLNGFPAIISEFDVFGTPTATPEPSTMALLAMGLISLLAYAWRNRK